MRIESRSRRAAMAPAGRDKSCSDPYADEKRNFYSQAPALPIPLDRGRVAQQWIPAQCRLLDIGCGAGYHVRHLARKAARVVAADVDSVSLSVARRRSATRRVAFLRYDGRRLPLADASFDAVTLLDVLEHVENREALVAEVARVLRPGGVWIVSVPYRGPWRRLSPENMARDYPRLFRLLDRLLPARFWIKAHNDSGTRHEHFSVAELKELTGQEFRAERTARRGSLAYALAYLGLCFPPPWFGRLWTSACFALMALDYQVPYGPCAYNLIMQFRRQASAQVRSSPQDDVAVTFEQLAHGRRLRPLVDQEPEKVLVGARFG